MRLEMNSNQNCQSFYENVFKIGGFPSLALEELHSPARSQPQYESFLGLTALA